RFATYGFRVPDLRCEEITTETLLELGRRLDLNGWLLFPTRDENVSALSRRRAALGEIFRVPTPEWSIIRWMVDKRNTYQLAAELHIPLPLTWTSLTED